MQRDLGAGFSFERKPCFVCGSLSHLIKDCDYYEKKMAKEAAFQSKRVIHANVRQATPAWTNSNRVNKANQFTPRPVQLNNIRPNFSTASRTIKTGRVNVNTGKQNVSSGRLHVSSGTHIKSGSSRVNTGKQHVNSGSMYVNSGTTNKSGSSRVNTGKQNANSGRVHVNTARITRPVLSNPTSQTEEAEELLVLSSTRLEQQLLNQGNDSKLMKMEAWLKLCKIELLQFSFSTKTRKDERGVSLFQETNHASGTQREETSWFCSDPVSSTKFTRWYKLVLASLTKLLEASVLPLSFPIHRTLMQSRFQMSSMGELTFFLGLQVKQNKDGIFISQDKYVAEMLKKFDLVNVKAAITPMETKLPLTKDETLLMRCLPLV
ncbi:ribonuclease H-like domain, reverse transcriptase, RNA-dependent DNA polymerase [Tanacetum coccineum]